jgi:hypothetical protein
VALMQASILPFRNAGTSCWRARLDGLSFYCIQKPGWGGKNSELESHRRLPNICRIGSKEE